VAFDNSLTSGVDPQRHRVIPRSRSPPWPDGGAKFLFTLVKYPYSLPVKLHVPECARRIVLVIDIVLLVFGQTGRPVGGRRYWY
jgi:hypothetical protein